jgi:hypothetical protein
MVMIFAVILIAAATTIIAASVDLGRMAVLKQNQSEREAKWLYCVDSAKALVVEDLFGQVGTTQSFLKTVNGISISVSAAPDSTWNSAVSTKVAVTGILAGQIRSSYAYVGKRVNVNPCHFAMFFTNKFQPNSATTIDDDIYLSGTIDASNLNISGDIFSPLIAPPTVSSQTGSFFGRQASQVITLDDSAYAAQADITSSGNITVNNPTNLTGSSNSQLRYHTGNLTVSGTTVGEITIYVNGRVTLNNPRNLLSVLSRLVIICNGDVLIEPGTTDAFVVSNGKVKSTGTSGNRTINGSLAGAEFPGSGDTYNVNFSNVFVSNPAFGTRYWIPGQW